MEPKQESIISILRELNKNVDDKINNLEEELNSQNKIIDDLKIENEKLNEEINNRKLFQEEIDTLVNQLKNKNNKIEDLEKSKIENQTVIESLNKNVNENKITLGKIIETEKEIIAHLNIKSKSAYAEAKLAEFETPLIEEQKLTTVEQYTEDIIEEIIEEKKEDEIIEQDNYDSFGQLPKDLTLTKLLKITDKDKQRSTIGQIKKIEQFFAYDKDDFNPSDFYNNFLNKETIENFIETILVNQEQLKDSTIKHYKVTFSMIFKNLLEYLKDPKDTHTIRIVNELYEYFMKDYIAMNDKIVEDKSKNELTEKEEESYIKFDELSEKAKQLRYELYNKNLEDIKDYRRFYNATLFLNIYALNPPLRCEPINMRWDKNEEEDYIDIENREFHFLKDKKQHGPITYKYGFNDKSAESLDHLFTRCRELYPNDKYLFYNYKKDGDKLTTDRSILKYLKDEKQINITIPGLRKSFCSSEFFNEQSEYNKTELTKKMRTSNNIARTNYKKITVDPKDIDSDCESEVSVKSNKSNKSKPKIVKRLVKTSNSIEMPRDLDSDDDVKKND